MRQINVSKNYDSLTLLILLLGFIVLPINTWAIPTGSLDTTFDAGGKLITDLSGDYDRSYAVTMRGNGKIIAFGSGGDLPTMEATVNTP